MMVPCLDEEVDVLRRGDAHVGRLDRALQALDHPLGVVVVLGILLPTQQQHMLCCGGCIYEVFTDARLSLSLFEHREKCIRAYRLADVEEVAAQGHHAALLRLLQQLGRILRRL